MPLRKPRTMEEACKRAHAGPLMKVAFQRTMRDLATGDAVSYSDSFDRKVDWWDEHGYLEEYGISPETKQAIKDAKYDYLESMTNPDGTFDWANMEDKGASELKNKLSSWVEGKTPEGRVYDWNRMKVEYTERFNRKLLERRIREAREVDEFLERYGERAEELVEDLYDLETFIADNLDRLDMITERIEEYRREREEFEELMEIMEDKERKEWARIRRRLGGYKTALARHHGIRREEIRRKLRGL